ncbi:MAG: hypothetical protein KAR47_13910, partial [Planctomycetes bacterium]|nr:hypothetical protein [Planctomycetota bacterium]
RSGIHHLHRRLAQPVSAPAFPDTITFFSQLLHTTPVNRLYTAGFNVKPYSHFFGTFQGPV